MCVLQVSFHASWRAPRCRPASSMKCFRLATPPRPGAICPARREEPFTQRSQGQRRRRGGVHLRELPHCGRLRGPHSGATRLYASKSVAVVAICVNRVEEDKLPALTKRAEKKGFAFQYLYDESQQIAKKYGVPFTPEFFVLNKDRKVVYMGAMDDSTDPAGVKTKYVEDALNAVLKGDKPPVSETIAPGCARPLRAGACAVIDCCGMCTAAID